MLYSSGELYLPVLLFYGVRSLVTKLKLLHPPNTAQQRPRKREPVRGRIPAQTYGRSYSAFRLCTLSCEGRDQFWIIVSIILPRVIRFERLFVPCMEARR